MADVKKMKSEFRKSYKVNRNQFISNFRSYSKSIRRLFIVVGIILQNVIAIRCILKNIRNIRVLLLKSVLIFSLPLQIIKGVSF